MEERQIIKIIFSLYRSNNFFFSLLLFRIFTYSSFLNVKIKSFIYILLACYLATFLRLLINNNFIISIIGSFLVGFIVSKRLSFLSEKFYLAVLFLVLHLLADLFIFCMKL